MVKYDTKLTNELCQTLSEVIDTAVSFYDENLAPQGHSKGTNRELCNAIRINNLGVCLQTDKNTLKRFQDGESDFYYSCHFGLIEFAYKISFMDKTEGYILVGPFRDEKKKKENLAAIEKLCELNPNFSYKTLKKAYTDIKVFSEQTFEAIKKLLSLVFGHSNFQKFIATDESVFEKVISPYIDEHIDGDLSLETLCKEFFLSQKQLYKIFYESTGGTPKKYINRVRALTARDLILSTNLTLPQISAKVGIPDYNYFIKIFKRYDGHTPMYYRKKTDNKTK